MKSVRRFALLGVVLFVCVTPLLAQNDGAFANGQFQFISDGAPASIHFSARQRSSVGSGEITFSSDALTVTVTVDCVAIAGNRAAMSGTITDSSQPELVGSRSLLVVEDNGQGAKATPDRVTWVVVSAGDCHALPPSAYALDDVTDGHIHVKASNAPF
jgi:hypothetical protein